MINELNISVTPKQAYDVDSIKNYLGTCCGFRSDEIKGIRILKRSIDARHKNILVNLKLRIYINEEPKDDEYVHTDYPNVKYARQVIVVGAGPGGLFAALKLIECGLKPVVVERGKNVRDRKRDMADISREHKVNPESNYCFGEGGAGAYSDGKLYTRSKKRGSVDKILNVFCQHGASTLILADAHPHIGTDKLPRVIENMRNNIIACGGEVHFETKMTSLIIEGDVVKGIVATDMKENRELRFEGPVILATGHSARDVYHYLFDNGIEIEAKGLAMGVRLEHPSHLIDQIQYHTKEGRGKYLPAAEYSFVTQVDGRGVYSFCMCPGGYVIPAATGEEQVVVNGMSPSNRGTKWSNSGMVVEIRPEDVEGDDALKMMRCQERLEKLTWEQAGKTQMAPAQRMEDFVYGRNSKDLPKTSFTAGLVISRIDKWMPHEISHRLQEGFKMFGRKSRGFLTNEAVLIASETRTSSPVRIVRDNETLQHIRIKGLFPCGEGAGYAGGIVSAGIDGERCAEAAAEWIKNR